MREEREEEWGSERDRESEREVRKRRDTCMCVVSLSAIYDTMHSMQAYGF